MGIVYTGMTIAVLGGAIGQLLMKSGMQALPYGEYSAMLNSLLFHPTQALLIISGIFCYVISMIVWVHTLKNNRLSKAYPVLSLGYVIVYFAASYWPGLNEPLTIQKTLGISLILLGVWITQTNSSADDA